ncbi:hypothetical protein I5907_09435 [Panacibacter sp. DH6]|uniref:Uncharacterized protein n=1 Tax=Panacibacter microcysteis TaxID=2793269 RepID=A0A931GXS2_9BACT|nr:hypothetical protein [Panacibacter microcysteis]MBG9376454.1 hypothetical protein [Panacibacter microcysteis]
MAEMMVPAFVQVASPVATLGSGFHFYGDTSDPGPPSSCGQLPQHTKLLRKFSFV